jgi:uncharacterized membrane protein YhaH (DUF805 family)
VSAKIGLWEHFRKLASFKGREDRASFWPYAAVVFVIVMVAPSVMFIPTMVRSIRAMQEPPVQPPDPASVEAAFDGYPMPVHDPASDMMPSPGFIAAHLGVMIGLAVVLGAAAIVRRLHDRGRSGAWGLMPLPFIVYVAIQVPRLFDSTTGGGQAGMNLILSVFLADLLFMIALVALIVLLAGASDPEPNGYDPQS